jgi:hypothetical protein
LARFLDGPAEGVHLQLHRAPVMLRAVRKPGGEWDALDAIDDEAEADEEIVVYRYAGNISRFHLRRSPRKLSGWYEDADYAVLAEQPPDEDVRSSGRWRSWVLTNREKLSEGLDLTGYDLGGKNG